MPGMAPHKPTVLYFTHADAAIYDLIREAAGARFRLAFLDNDDDEERCRRIADCEAVICAATPLRRHHLEAASGLRIVHHQGVGWHDTTDWQAIRDKGIPLAITTAGTTIGVAEHTILLMLAAAKRLSFADAALREGYWHVNALRGVSRELHGKTVGYVGMGRIARAVAERLKAFGCAGIYTDPGIRLEPQEEAALGLRQGGLDTVLAASDFLTIHTPLTAETHNLIDVEALRRLKPGAIVVNTARGGIIDEAALAEALKSGHVLAAGLDVFATEPPKPDNPLLALENVILTPHISAGTQDAMRQKMAAIFENLDRFFSGEGLQNQVRFP